MKMKKNHVCAICHTNQSGNEPRKFCESCNIVYESSYVKNHETNSSAELRITGKSNYFHLNNEIMLNDDDSGIFIGKNLLLVGTGSTSKLNIVKMMKSQLNKIICVSPHKTWAYPFVDHWILAEDKNVEQKEETLKRVLAFMEKEQVKFDGIMNYYDGCCMMTFYLADRLHLTSIPLNIGNQLKNKYEFRRKCKELKIPSPNHFFIESNQREIFLSNLDMKDQTKISSANGQAFCSFPLIVKDPFGFVKSFVKKCQNVDEFVRNVKESLDYNINLLVEEFFEGHEIDCDLLIQNNQVKFLAITDNFPPLEPNFIEQGGTVPSHFLSKQEQDEIRNLISKWASQLNIQNACIHFEARCRPESIFKKANFDMNANLLDESYFLMPIEVNLRVGGAEVWSMIKAVYGVDLIKENLKIAFNMPLDEAKLKFKANNPRCKCISKDFDSTKTVNINSIKLQVDELIQNPDIVELVIFHLAGENLLNSKDIWLTIKNDDLESSMEKMQTHLENVLKSIRFEPD